MHQLQGPRRRRRRGAGLRPSDRKRTERSVLFRCNASRWRPASSICSVGCRRCLPITTRSLSLLYLLNGKFAMLPRLFYLYDFGVWEKTETGQKRDVDTYSLKWAWMRRSTRCTGSCAASKARCWRCTTMSFPIIRRRSGKRSPMSGFQPMFIRFKGHKRMTFGSPHAEAAEKAAARLQTTAGSMSFDAMLAGNNRGDGAVLREQGAGLFRFLGPDAQPSTRRRPDPSRTFSNVISHTSWPSRSRTTSLSPCARTVA